MEVQFLLRTVKRGGIHPTSGKMLLATLPLSSGPYQPLTPFSDLLVVELVSYDVNIALGSWWDEVIKSIYRL